MNKIFLLGLSCLLLCQCSSVRFSGPAPNPPITQLSVVNNDDVHMGDFQEQLVDQIRAMGISTTVVSTPPQGNMDYLTYTANWRWDLGMYLRYFKATLHRGQTATRSVVYENVNVFTKFGEAENKVRVPMRQLLLGRP